MTRKSLILALIAFCLSCLTLKGAFTILKEREKRHDKEEIKIVHEAIKDQFKLVLTLPSFLASGGARNFSDGDLKRKAYSRHAPSIIKEHKDIIGLNILDNTGVIVRVYPEDKNNQALGQVTQNLNELLVSYAEGKHEWLSPPFDLYQGEKGFAFYSPIITNDKKLKGWFATVIGGHEFFDKFRLNDILETYELIIKDAETGQMYFSSAIDNVKGYESKVKIKNRELIFKCWRKKEYEIVDYPWYICILISLLISGVTVYIYHLREHRRVSRRQLKDVRVLLQMTAKEALSSLIDLRTDKQIYQKELNYLTNLIEQIDLLQTMADPESKPKPPEHYELLPLVQNQIEDFREVLDKKKILINFDYQSMSHLSVLVNERLVQHGLIHHVLFHLIVHSQENAEIKIFQSEKSSHYELHFISNKIMGPEAFMPDRRFEVARRVMDLCGGELALENAENNGLLIKLTFPVRLKIDRSV